MQMQFNSFTEVLAMGGHGAYVWAAYGITSIVLVGLVLTPIVRRRSFVRDQLGRIKRERAAVR